MDKSEKKDIKSCSSSSIYLSSTITQPNVKLLIKAVATILQSQLIEDMQLGKTISTKSDLYYFSEDKYINEFPGYFDEQKIELLHKPPSHEDIVDFIEVKYYFYTRLYITVLNFLLNVVF
jgi:hypothetical protein